MDWSFLTEFREAALVATLSALGVLATMGAGAMLAWRMERRPRARRSATLPQAAHLLRGPERR
ncbi:MAG TPA: hypothetical protein VEA81_09050 [Burkholderiaceae bacterium]|nr:hypothetical protein [Burkholderiaceae bacterium]